MLSAAGAFVAADAQRRELDVHVVDIGPDGCIVQHYGARWPFPDSTTGDLELLRTD